MIRRFSKCMLLIVAAFTTMGGNAQGLFNSVYPIGDSPNIGYKSGMVNDIEKPLFEANPILRLPIYNNIRARLQNDKKSASTMYINFRSQLRMYDDNSLPVKTPSYKISILGFQYLKRLSGFRGVKSQLLAASFESGHYSNGQADCAFCRGIPDGSKACDSVYSLITPDTDLSKILNRSSANFSTNFTEVIVNYRMVFDWDEYFVPTRAISIKAGLNAYHNKLLHVINIGGYSNQDIRIYGRNRIIGGVEYFFSPRQVGFLNKINADRFSFAANTEYIDRPHPSVEPWRAELTATIYFKNHMGVFVSGITGHDNYNFRFVDSGSEIFAGITFDIFPPVQLSKFGQ